MFIMLYKMLPLLYIDGNDEHVVNHEKSRYLSLNLKSPEVPKIYQNQWQEYLYLTRHLLKVSQSWKWLV